MKRYKHVFFDLDETLWDFRRNSVETLHDLFGLYHLSGFGMDENQFIERYHHHNEIYWGQFRRGEISRTELRVIRFKTTLKEFELTDEALIKKMSENYLQILPSKKNLYEGTIDVLEYLKPKYSLHIITNGFEEVQQEKIKVSGLVPYFKYIITSERAGSLKPNREIFLYALDIANASVADSIFIGDSIEADMRGAIGVGMDCVLFNPEQMDHRENVAFEIRDLAELKKIL